jgi:hemoglobin
MGAEQGAASRTPFEWIGGEPAVRRIASRFYELMANEPSLAGLRAVHAADLEPMRERLGDFLVGWLGGPPLYFQRADARCMGQAHAPVPIDAGLRDQWLACMERALSDCGVDPALQGQVLMVMGRMAEGLRNR